MEHLEQVPLLVFSNIVFVLFLFLLTHSAFCGRNLTFGRNLFIIVMCFVFCLFSFWGADWFGYQSYFEWVRSGSISNVSMEEFYLWLMEDVCSNYIVFRAIVWGSSLIFLTITFRKLQLNVGLALFFFCSIYLIYFSYARATLAISMMCYGYSCLWKEKNFRKKNITIWGLLWVMLAFFFHKSAVMGIASIFAALFVLKIPKIGIRMVIVTFPIIILLMNVFFQDYFSVMATDEGIFSEYASAGADYLEKKNGRLGVSTIISWILERSPYYLLAFASYRELRKPSINHPVGIRAFLVLEFLLVIFSSVFLFDLGVNTSTIYGRFIRFAQIPSVVILTYLYENSMERRPVKLAYSIGIANCAYTLLYSFYNTFTV